MEVDPRQEEMMEIVQTVTVDGKMTTANVGGDSKNKWAQKPREYKFKTRSKTSNYIL